MHLTPYNSPLEKKRFQYQRHLHEQGSFASGENGKSYNKSVQTTITQNKTVYKTADVNFSGLSSSMRDFSVKVFARSSYENFKQTINSSSATIMKKLSKKEWFKKMLAYIDSNQLMADAIFAAIITCGMRPLMIMAIPSKEEDKDKNSYAAAHSISSGILGVVFAALFAKPVATAIEKKLKKDAGKYLKKNTDYVTGFVKSITFKKGDLKKGEPVNNLRKSIKEHTKGGKTSIKVIKNKDGSKTFEFYQATAFKTLSQQIPQLFIMPMKAMATIALVPVILAKAFNLSKKKNKDKDTTDYNNLLYSQTQNTPQEFKQFIQPSKQKPNFTSNAINFTGVASVAAIATKAVQDTSKTKGFISSSYDKYIDKTSEVAAKGLGKIAQMDWFKKLTLKVGSFKNHYSHILAAESFYLSGFYIYNTMTSKTIEEKQKMPLALNQGLVTVISTLGAYTIENLINKWFTKGEKILEATVKETSKKGTNYKKYNSGLSKFKTLIVFGLIYRFAAPVLITPIANRISNEIQKHKDKQQKQNAQKAA